ncbi:NAD-dependent epimerase/dehydratase family protein [Cellulomonas sp. DKR-3]|uniref:NAD-dependent epimerase/dehydratase family protein n=1 Tax=Cellulomonas fulva TaxID=2835530 RepID=A0ABS5U0Q9_9CELL|nr:NAD-dependent epimerase/dehydratase family protein [Cellulomonas fulva]MBT0994980.1 NAD-dependent epimerase/dehydratase family protein [Cellulomonas fulva]
MRVAVTGCTGNVGTALLRRLRDEPAVSSVVGVARRVPRRAVPAPYDAVDRWVACDVAAPDAASRLAAAFDGADAVVHLAWAIQPSHDRERLRATNVDGTRAVLAAAESAGVAHVVAASSVGTYAAVGDDEPRTEAWASTGIPTSSYSSDKAAVERLLDEGAGRGRPVARVRSALVFQRGAGAEVGRLFLGPLVPKALLRGPLPVLPWPAGLRLQAVHADDLADAYVRILTQRATGAFNVAGDGVLRADDVAEVLRAPGVLPVPPGALRVALDAAWRARLAVVGPGWLDMATGAPVMDTARVRQELGWLPRRTGREALAEVLDGLATGAGTASRPLHPRRRLLGAS